VQLVFIHEPKPKPKLVEDRGTETGVLRSPMNRFEYLEPIGSVPVHHGHQNFCCIDFGFGNFEDVLGQDNKIRVLACLERTRGAVLLQSSRCIDSNHSNRSVDYRTGMALPPGRVKRRGQARRSASRY